MVGDTSPRDYQTEADDYLARAIDGLPAGEAALALAVLLNRAASRLHNVARAESASTKGTPEWASWAGLQNTTRSMVLQASTCRDVAAKLIGRRR
jgi:hypothetical protein